MIISLGGCLQGLIERHIPLLSKGLILGTRATGRLRIDKPHMAGLRLNTWDKIWRNPNLTAVVLIDDVMDKYYVQITNSKAYRANGHALQLLRGFVVDHYARLQSYIIELKRVDPDGRFEFILHDDTTFKGFYVGFSGLRKGFMKGCRPIIGFDGCFLNTFLGGALLSAIAKDENNQMFPICWAVMESENEEYWT
ncbi:uncharacterized protein LOC126654917 [Mercurialis annua]|uniref:uncharacterized protein LOC126654917 n=1 Tax=Mercurialis annua TaxID=3986 RepID=UPI00215FE238|nr:uncharacterized protein LOC126654917 [Mercurialis annua]